MRRVRGETALLHRTFILGIGAKGIFGLFEVLGALLALLITPAQLHSFFTWLTAEELREDPRAFVAQFVLHLGNSINLSQTHYVALYLAVHGVTKVVLVLALMRGKNWAYPWMLVALAVFIVTQIWQMIASFTWGMLALTLFDGFILWLTAREWKLHRASRG